jgi:hypothetical protein
VSGESTNATGPGPRGDRGEAADLGTHSEANEASALAAAAAASAGAGAPNRVTGRSILAANTVAALDARGASPQGATHLSGAVTPRPPRGRRRLQNHNGIDAPQVRFASLDSQD